MGASLLIFLNKTDVEGCMNEEDIRLVSLRVPARRISWGHRCSITISRDHIGPPTRFYQNPQLEDLFLQRNDRT
jgi:hypothetical protein